MPQPEPSSDVSWRGRDEGRVRTGMTLLELLIVVGLVGIMAAFAIPSYQRMRERRYYGEAQNILHAIYSGERTYFFQKGDYLNNPTTAVQWQQIRMEEIVLPPRLRLLNRFYPATWYAKSRVQNEQWHQGRKPIAQRAERLVLLRLCGITK